MAGRLRSMVQGVVHRLGAAAHAVHGVAIQTHAARIVIMAHRLRRGTPLLATLICAVFLLCLHLGWSTGRGMHAALLPASPTGIGAILAGIVAGLAVLELTAALCITLMAAALQLAYDTGRHRILSLLAIASALALGALAWRLADVTVASPGSAVLPVLLTGGLMALTIWFERAYLRPAYPGFRDFWADVVDARHFLNRAAHGE